MQGRNKSKYPLPRIKLIAMATLLATVIISSAGGCSRAEEATLTVAAAASLTDSLTSINELFRQEHNIIVNYNFAASGDLRTQIENGAPVDIFFAAAASHIDQLAEKSMILSGTRREILSNQLVLITHKDNDTAISDFAGLLNPEVGIIAMGDPEFVPAGKYSLQTLEELKIPYDQLKPKVVLASNVRQVLSHVENRSAEYGLVYLTDAKASELVKIIAVAPAAINEKIIYPVAVIVSSKNAEAANAYLTFLESPAAQSIFIEDGFTFIGEQ